MDFLSWLAKSAPWLQPLIAVGVLLVSVIGPGPTVARDEVTGRARHARFVTEPALGEPAPGEPAAETGEESEKPLEGFAWEIITAIGSEPRHVFASVALGCLLGWSISVGRRAKREAAGPRAPAVPFYAQRENRSARRSAYAWALGGLLLGQLALAVYMVPKYLAPKKLDRVGEAVACPRDLAFPALVFWGDVYVKNLYSWAHGVDPDRGRDSYLPDLDQFGRLAQYFRQLARVTIWSLLLLVALASLFSALQAKGLAARPRIVLQTILLLSMSFHTFQWLWLVESFGRLRLASSVLELGADRYLSAATKRASGSWHLPRARKVEDRWPFTLVLFKPRRVVWHPGREVKFEVHNYWPLAESFEMPIAATGLELDGKRLQPPRLGSLKLDPETCEGGVYPAALELHELIGALPADLEARTALEAGPAKLVFAVGTSHLSDSTLDVEPGEIAAVAAERASR